MTAGPIHNLRITRTTKNSFSVAWITARGAQQGYSYIVRDLAAHQEIRQGHTTRTSVTISGLQPGKQYNFGVQGLPGGPGANVHITTSAASGRVTKKSGGTPPRQRGTSSVPQRQGGLKGFAMVLMVRYGWGLGEQWVDFQNVEMREAGWNPFATNPASGAFGLGQALGHGTSNTHGSVTNEYGDFGTSDAVCRAANSGNGYAQLIWMVNYIRIKYGNPAGAWYSEQVNGAY